MDIALTLVVNPGCSFSLEKIIAQVRDLNGHEPDIRILSEGKAADLIYKDAATDATSGATESATNRATLATFTRTLSPPLNSISGLDWCLGPEKYRKKRLILADMDSTMITVECIDELADFIGLKDKVAAITEAAMRGELDFEGALTERVALLKGLSRDALERCYNERISLMSGARILVQTMKKHGAQAVLVSGGFTYFTERVAAAIGFDVHRANVLEFNGDALSGTVQHPICGAQTKLDTLLEYRDKLGIETRDILAVGDGANDIPMIEAAGLGVAYHAKPKTQAAAAAAVRFGDLTTLLYYQGFSDNEFVS